MSKGSRFSIKLFYSYSHKDFRYRERLEDSLTLLKEQDNILDDWSDTSIRPGQSIPKAIVDRMNVSHVFVFLVSPHFIASPACREEWNRAGQIANDRFAFRVPIILSNCAWKDLAGMSELKALPNDGNR